MTQVDRRRLRRARREPICRPLAVFLKATELDTRMLGMVGALAADLDRFPRAVRAACFLTPRNLWNLSVQIIVRRHHGDRHGAGHRHAQHRPVGRLDARLHRHGHGRRPGRSPAEAPRLRTSGHLDHRAGGRLVARRRASARSRASSSPISAVPSFIVTLGGLLVWRGAAWWVTSGQTVAPLDSTFQLMGGGPEGSIGATWSWVVGVVACVAVVLLLAQRPRAAQAFRLSAAADLGRGLPRRRRLRADPRRGRRSPMPIPGRSASCAAMPRRNDIALPEGGLFIAHGIAVPVLIAIGVGVVMTFLADAHALRPLRLRHRRQPARRPSSPASTRAG